MKRPSLIQWRDAYGIAATWMHEDDPIPPPIIVTTIGYVIPKARKGYVVVADSVYDGEGGKFYGGVTVIPDDMIVERRKM